LLGGRGLVVVEWGSNAIERVAEAVTRKRVARKGSGVIRWTWMQSEP
jgi:hypothetical protein